MSGTSPFAAALSSLDTEAGVRWLMTDRRGAADVHDRVLHPERAAAGGPRAHPHRPRGARASLLLSFPEALEHAECTCIGRFALALTSLPV